MGQQISEVQNVNRKQSKLLRQKKLKRQQAEERQRQKEERERQKEEREQYIKRKRMKKREEQKLQNMNKQKLENNEEKLEAKLLRMKAKEKNAMKQELEYEQQREAERSERIERRKEEMLKRHELKMKEHQQLMDGLKGFLTEFSKISKPDSTPKSIPMSMMRQNLNWNTMQRMNQYMQPSFGYGSLHQKQDNDVHVPPPLFPPIPPLPAKYLKKMPGVNMVGNQRQLLHYEDDFELIAIKKCLYNEEFGELCIEYNYEHDIVSFDVIAPKYKESHENESWIVYEFELDSQKKSCDNFDIVPFAICLKRDDVNDDVVIYFEDNENSMEQMLKLELNWNRDNDWSEIT